MSINYEDRGSPYQKGEVLQIVVERVAKKPPEIKAYIPTEEKATPYMSMQLYSEHSGIVLNTSKTMAQGAIKKKQRLVGKRVGNMFSEECDGLFVALDQALYGDKLANFSIQIVGFKEVYHRSGEPTKSIVIRISGAKKELEILTEEYDGVLDRILKKYRNITCVRTFVGRRKPISNNCRLGFCNREKRECSGYSLRFPWVGRCRRR